MSVRQGCNSIAQDETFIIKAIKGYFVCHRDLDLVVFCVYPHHRYPLTCLLKKTTAVFIVMETFLTLR